MGNFIGYMDGFDEAGHPRGVGRDELHTDTVHPQGTSAANLEIDFVGSDTLKQLNPQTGVQSNAPSNDQKLIPVGATVVDGVIIING